MQIFISCGHNNARNIRNILIKDQGAVSGEYTEYGIVKEVARLLPARYKGSNKLLFVPEGLSLVDRISWINNRSMDGDVAIELHMNAGGGKGTEVFYFSGSDLMRGQADKFNKVLTTTLNTVDRGVKGDTQTRFGRLGFIRDTKPLALLVELGFVDNFYDRKQVIDYGATAMANALMKVYP